MADLIFFAVIAAVILWRLKNVLGTEVDVERDKPTTVTPIRPEVKNPEVAQAKEPATRPAAKVKPVDVPADLAKPVADAKKIDPDFDPATFIAGAKVAFEMIFDAYQHGDRDTLKDLISPALYKEFDAAITQRATADEKEETTLIALASAALESMKVRAGKASIAVRFMSEQVSLVRDKQGAVIRGNSRHVEQIEEVWTFERDLRSDDPTWLLTDIEEQEAA